MRSLGGKGRLTRNSEPSRKLDSSTPMYTGLLSEHHLWVIFSKTGRQKRTYSEDWEHMVRNSSPGHARKQLRDPGLLHLEGGRRWYAAELSEELKGCRTEWLGWGLFFCHQRAKLRPKGGSQEGASFCSDKSRLI